MTKIPSVGEPVKMMVWCRNCNKIFDVERKPTAPAIFFIYCDSCLDKMVQSDRDQQTGVNDLEDENG